MQTIRNIGRGLIAITRYTAFLVVLVGIFCLGIYTYTRVSDDSSSKAYAATSSTLNFQGRLLQTSGSPVPDGYYNIEFKLYTGGTQGGGVGVGQANAGTLQWTETYYDSNGASPGNDNRVKVSNGYFTVNLGSLTSYPGTMKWDQEHWLTMNVGGSTQTATPTWDGEMLAPGNTRTKLTATPYSFASAQAKKLIDDQVSGTGTLEWLTLTGNRTISLPDASGTVLLNSTGFANGGNSFSGTAVLGTNDANDLVLETGGVEGLRIDQDGDVSIGTSADAVEKLEVNGGIKFGNTTNSNAGTIRWTGTDFEGYDGSQWKSLTLGSTQSASASFVSGLANVGANVTGTAVETLVFTSATAISNTAGVTGFTAPASGSFTTCLIKNNANITGGTLNLRWRVNGVSVGSGACTMNTSKPRESAAALPTGTVSFQAGDTIGVAFDTVGLAPAGSNDFTVYWTVQYTTGGNSGQAFTQGGNIFGGTAILGTNDNQALSIITNNTQALGINAAGQAQFAQNVIVGNGLSVTTGGASISGNTSISGGGTFSLDSSAFDVSAAGALSGITTINASGAISGATATNTINGLIINAGSLSGITGFIQAAGNFSYSNAAGNFSIDSSAFDVTTAGAVSGVQSLTGSGALTVASGGSGALTLDSASNVLQIAASDTILQRTAAGAYTIDLNDSGATTLTLNNSGSGAASLNLQDGGLQVAGTSVLTNGRALQNLTGLTISSGGASITGGINNNSGGITNIGAISGISTLSLSGAISGATATDTINGLIINTGSLSGITGFTQNSGNFAYNNGTGSFSINSSAFDVSAAGALSGVTTLNLSGAISGATATNTINGLVINSGALSGISGVSQLSGNFAFTNNAGTFSLDSSGLDVTTAGALSGITTIGASGAITAATATNTINGLVINGGALSSVTGIAQTSGNFAQSGTGTFGTGTGAVSLNGATTISTNTASATALTVNGTTGTAATALNIAQTGNAANLTMSNTARTAGALVSLTQSTSAFTGTGLLLNFASGSGSFASGNFADFQVNGASRFRVDNTGALEISSNSALGLNVESTGGLSYFSVDVAGSAVRIGSATADATAVLMVLDTKNTSGDPAGINGGSYYNSNDKRFRCYEDGRWKDCIVSTATPKTANQTVTNSATFTNDSSLLFPMDASSTYTFTASINFSSTSAAADFKYTFTVPTGAVVSIQSAAPTSATASTTCNITASGQTCTLASTAGYRGTMDITGYVSNGTTAGNLQFQFAQNTQTAGQSVTVYGGSSINWKRTLP